MTIRLYDKDVDMLDFSAVVKTCAQRENGYVVTLDQTAFFPEGGGQGADHGTLGGAQAGYDAAAQRRAHVFRIGARPFRV